MNYVKKGQTPSTYDSGKQEFQSLLKETPIKVDKEAELEFLTCAKLSHKSAKVVKQEESKKEVHDDEEVDVDAVDTAAEWEDPIAKAYDEYKTKSCTANREVAKIQFKQEIC